MRGARHTSGGGMTRKVLSLSALFLFSLSRLFAQEVDLALPSREILKTIFNKPGIVKTDVSQEKGDDHIRWVEMYTDVHIATDIPMEKLRREILNFDNYPQIFRRNQRVATIRTDGRVYLDMAVGAEFLGIAFITNYRVLVTELINTPEKFVLDFSHVSDDGSVKDIYGRWYLERIPRSGNGEEQCYVRYYASSKVVRKYPFLRMIMSMFINSESRDLMNQFLKAAGGL
jgi:hypothetical protein